VTAHDIRDHDFQASPIVTATRVYGAGKGGRVVAWNRATKRRVWSTAVGTHLHDSGPLPVRPTLVCPGLWGGVLTPMALAGGRLFVPVVEQCVRESAVRSADLPDATKAAGVLYALDAATGRKLWFRGFGSALFGCATAARDVVFAPTFDGRVYALDARDGSVLWSAHAGAGTVACPAVAGDLLLVPTGVARRPAALVAYGLPRSRA
jgi:outer membrane protein assembly factor BamB